jgi:hypothetical protein
MLVEQAQKTPLQSRMPLGRKGADELDLLGDDMEEQRCRIGLAIQAASCSGKNRALSRL